jgi:hypothetical protein
MNDCCNPATDNTTLLPVMTPCVMLNRAVYAYQQVLLGMTGGKAVIEVSFNGQTAKYQANNITLDLLRQQVERLHPHCPTPEGAAIIGGKRGNIAAATLARPLKRCDC